MKDYQTVSMPCGYTERPIWYASVFTSMCFCFYKTVGSMDLQNMYIDLDLITCLLCASVTKTTFELIFH